MEDQQSAAGDLTDADPQHDDTRRRHRMPVGKARRSAVPLADAPEPDAAEAVEAVAPEAEPAEAVAPEAETTGGRVIFVERKPPGARAPIAIGVAAALFVAAGAFAGATVQPYLADRAQVDIKLDIARTAAEAITTLWTYTPDNMEQLADRSAKFLSGDFQTQYRKYVDAIVPTNKQAQVTNTTQVVGAAVESLPGPGATEATAIVYTNSTATSPLTKNIPSMRYLSYRLTLQRDKADWLVTKMSTITSLDLTPQL
ncbi:MAG: mammalian cell entry protein [Mycobacterium sp.]